MVTLQEALDVSRELNPAFRRAGYLLLLYGSCLLEGAGNDIDICAEPFRPDAREDELHRGIGMMGFSREVSAGYYEGVMANSCVYSRHYLFLDLRISHVRREGTRFAFPFTKDNYEQSSSTHWS